MPERDLPHSEVLYTWTELGKRSRAKGYVPRRFLKDADHRPEVLIHELTSDTRLGVDLSEKEPVKAIVDLGPAEFKLKLETDEDGEPTCTPISAPKMN